MPMRPRPAERAARRGRPDRTVRRSAAWAAALALALVGLTAAPGIAAPSAPGSLGGERIEGSTDPAHPTDVEAGTWTDTLPREGAVDSALYYRYTRTVEDSSVVVGVASTGATGESDGLALEVFDDTGQTCAESEASRNDPGTYPFGVAVWAGPDEYGDREAPCLVSEFLTIKVSNGFSSTTGDVDFTLRVTEERPLVRGEELPEAIDTSATIPLPPEGDGPESTGGSSFLDAPEIGTGSFTTTLTQNEYAVWRVPLTFGEELRVRATAAPVDVPDDGSTSPVAVLLFSPSLSLLSAPYDTGDTYSVADFDSEREVTLADATGQVRYLNRFADGPSLPGDYLLVLGVAAPYYVDGGLLDVPLRVDVEVAGQPDGVPEFAGGDPYITGDGAVTVGAEEPDAEAGGRGLGRTLAAGALALCGLLSVTGGVVSLRRR